MSAVDDVTHTALGHIHPITDEQAHAAALTICGRVADLDEARRILDRLGITEQLRGEA